MSAPYRDDVVLAPASVLRPGEIERLNSILEDAGLGRPLRHPEGHRDVGAVALLPVAGAGPTEIRDELRRSARERGEEVPDVTPNYEYRSHTVEEDARDATHYDAHGKAIGHGTIAWKPAPWYEMPCPPAWQPVTDPPVVALLDTSVHDHAWLPGPDASTPFRVDAAVRGWASPADTPEPERGQSNADFGSHWGHATFVAGLIRLAAPDARILTLPVMDHRGKVSEALVIDGLNWLAEHASRYRGLVVLMAFGREADANDDMKKVRAALRALADQEVPVVASAGNDGTDQRCYPAAFAADPELSVVSVGAGASPTERAPFSNYGEWVRAWRDGTNVVSLMPVTATATGCPDRVKEFAEREETSRATSEVWSSERYARWSGTSFAAATYAGELTQRMLTDK